MSEIEIIKKLKYLVNEYNRTAQLYSDFFIDKKDIEALQVLLDLYNKEKEKNEKLETQLDVYRVYTKQNDLNNFDLFMKQHYISKDKIKKYKNAIETKISSIEIDRDYGRYKRYGGKIKCEKYLAQLYGYKKALQDLLEEDNK